MASIAFSEKGKKLYAELLGRADQMLVFLGTNDIGMVNALTKRNLRGASRELLDRANERRVDFIALGPPAFPSRPSLDEGARAGLEGMQEALGRRVIDLRPLTFDLARTKDGVHFPATSARILAERIRDELLGVKAQIGFTASEIAAGLALAYGLYRLTR
jgi:lysophospholipase L1-like esterase